MDQPSEAHPTPTTLYRLYDPEGTLLYVGIAGNPGRRLQDHRRDKPWWGEVSVIKLEHFPSRPEAEAHEVAAIHAERPTHNVLHSTTIGFVRDRPESDRLSDGRRAVVVAAEMGISRSRYAQRRYIGWSPEQAASTPVEEPPPTSKVGLWPGDTWGRWVVVSRKGSVFVLRCGCGYERQAGASQFHRTLNCPPCWRKEQGHKSPAEHEAAKAAKDEARRQEHPIGTTRNGWTIIAHLGFRGSGLLISARHTCGAVADTTVASISGTKPPACPCEG